MSGIVCVMGDSKPLSKSFIRVERTKGIEGLQFTVIVRKGSMVREVTTLLSLDQCEKLITSLTAETMKQRLERGETPFAGTAELVMYRCGHCGKVEDNPDEHQCQAAPFRPPAQRGDPALN